jgi:hypothetical protein
VTAKSRAAPLTNALAAAAAEAWKSGRIDPVRPLATPWLFDGVDLAELERRLLELHREVEGLIDDSLAIDPRVRANARLDLAAGRRLSFTRYDVMCPPDEPLEFRLLEVQAGDPSAMGFTDCLSAAFAAHVDARPAWLMESLRAHLGAPREIAFVVARGSMGDRDHALLAEHCRRNGWPARTVDPRALRFDGTHLSADGERVEVVFRDAIDELVEAPWSEGGKALLDAHAASAVTVFNPFSAAWADDKGLLTRLKSPHVPPTHLLDGARVVQVGAQREDWVLKPTDGFGGFGVVVGPFVTDAEWSQALAAAIAGPRRWVLQRHVALPRQTVAILDDQGRAHEDERFVVHSLWVHGVRFAGAFVRASQHPVVNVHRGGGLAPVFFRPRFL